jgi:hypothetical protein
MDDEHHCTECGGLQDFPGVCAPCVAFAEAEEAAATGREP